MIVVLDLDDTLYLEVDYIRSGFTAVGETVEADLGLPGFADVAWGHFNQGRRGDIFDLAWRQLSGEPASPQRIAGLVQTFRHHQPQIALADDAVAFLELMETKGMPLAMITDGHHASQHAKLQALELGPRLRQCIVTDTLAADRGAWKPAPLAYQMVEKEFPGETYAYIGDNPNKDFRVPAARGWTCVRIHRPAGIYAHVAAGPELMQTVELLTDPRLLAALF